VAAVSCGIVEREPVLDLDYAEDSAADVDGNFVMTDGGALVEVQMSAEGRTFERAEMSRLLELAEHGVGSLVALQKGAL
jgi:ribonuclease PH